MNLHAANFQDLLRAYYEGTRAKEAAEHLRREIEQGQNFRLATLLRDYRDRAIVSRREIELRASIDDLMIFYGVLEISMLAGFIAPPAQPEFWQTMKTILTNIHVQVYYERFYPLKLPQLLRRRLEGRHIRIEADTPALTNCIIQFLVLDQQFMSTLNDGYLLRMLDSFVIDGCRFKDVVGLIGNPEEFIRRILLPLEECQVPDLVLREFNLFMQFSVNFHGLLNQLEDYPLLQSEVWNQYSYWFGIIGEQLKRQLGDALNEFLCWEPSGGSQGGMEEIQRDVAQARQVIEKLTSPVYGAPVDALLKEPSRV